MATLNIIYTTANSLVNGGDDLSISKCIYSESNKFSGDKIYSTIVDFLVKSGLFTEDQVSKYLHDKVMNDKISNVNGLTEELLQELTIVS